MAESTIEPEELYIDLIEGGKVRLLCRWDIKQVSRKEESGDTISWTYSEAALWWTIPYTDSTTVLDTVDTIEPYLLKNKEEILNFAKGTKVTIKDAAKKVYDMRKAQAEPNKVIEENNPSGKEEQLS